MIILIAGRAASGKDTIGQYLINHYGFKKDSLAAPLKRLAADIFGIPDNILNPRDETDRHAREAELSYWPGWTPRKLLQFVGTELFREQVVEDIWVRSLWMRLSQEPQANWVVPDLRFPNEKDFLVDHYQGEIHTIRVIRPGCDGNTRGGIKAHASETHEIEADFVIQNDGTFENLYAQIDAVLKHLSLHKGMDVADWRT